MDILYDIAMSYLGVPYLWGGDDFSGYDCSGLLQEILASVGEDPPGDQTAQALFDHFKKDGNHVDTNPQLGALAFYGENSFTITHCTFLLSETIMIEASGGGRHITDVSTAIKFNAFVKIRPFRTKQLLSVLVPEYHLLEK